MSDGPGSSATTHEPGAPPPVTGRRPRRGLLVAAVVVVGATFLWLAAACVGDDDSQGSVPSIDDLPDDPGAAFGEVERRLGDDGSFAYTGGVTRRAPDGEHYVQVSGDVDVPNAYFAKLVPGTGAEEWIERRVVGDQAWTRATIFPNELDGRPWAATAEETDWFDPRPVPDWLSAAVDHRDMPVVNEEERVIRATLPSEALDGLGIGSATGDAEIVLTVSWGEIVELQVTAEDGDDTIAVDLTLRKFGHADSVDPPDSDDVDQTPHVAEEDLAEAHLTPIGLAELPESWSLAAARVSRDADSGCELAVLEYAGPDAELRLAVTPSDCTRSVWPDDPLDTSPTRERHSSGEESVADMAVRYDATGLTAPDLNRLLSSLTPIDPSTQPHPD